MDPRFNKSSFPPAPDYPEIERAFEEAREDGDDIKGNHFGIRNSDFGLISFFAVR